MKVAVVFVLLFATVLCRPAKKVTISSSESSEEVRRPAIRNKEALVPQTAPVQAAAAASASDESADLSAEVEEAAEAPAPDYKSSGPDTTSAPETETASVSDDSHDDDDDDDDDTDTEEEESSDSDESGESSTLAPVTVSPVIVTEEPAVGTTEEPIVPTIVAGPETARGDSLGRYPSDYKSIVYGGEDKSYHKVPAPYKSYEYVDAGKKAAYDMTHGNEVEKSLKVYKALQVHSDLLEEDTSTPDVESQGLDAAQDQDISVRQASIPGEPEEEESASEASAGQSDSTSAPQEEDDESASAASDSASASLESEDEESQSSEEATATPGAADSDSDESDSVEGDSDEEGAVPVATTDVPMVITAK
uniref:Secreted phosphoprotein 1 n=1 Tax=Scophthalmus maximus TaxID=52904 RepID=A0A8D3AQI9_SCOMX